MKQEEKNRRSRECIEEAAIRSFARQGPDNANLNQLCRENGISKGKLYHYYASKDDLLVACVQRIVDRLVAGICAFSPDPEQGVATNLHVYYKERIDFWYDDPEALSLIWYCLHLTNEALRSRLTEQRHRTIITLPRTICLWLVCNALWIDWLLVYVHFRRIRSRVLLPICMCITRNVLIFGMMTRKRCL